MIKFGARRAVYSDDRRAAATSSKIPIMTKQNTARHGTAFAVTVDATASARPPASARTIARRRFDVSIAEDAQPRGSRAARAHQPAARRNGGVLVPRGADRRDRRSLHDWPGSSPRRRSAKSCGEDGEMMRRPELEAVLPGARPEDVHASPT